MRRSRAVSSTRCLDLGARHALAHKRKADVLAHVHVRVEREELEHEGDVALGCALEGDVLAVEQDFSRGRQLEPGDHPERRRLAAAGGPEHDEELAVLDGEGSNPRTATKSANCFRRCSTRISAMARHSGKWLTMTNIAVPTRMVTNDQVKSAMTNGCISMTMPRPIRTTATFSHGPRRKKRATDVPPPCGEGLAGGGAADRWPGAPPHRSPLPVKAERNRAMAVAASFPHRPEGDAAQQLLPRAAP